MTSYFLAAILSSFLATASLQELFQKAKQEFKLGSYERALATLTSLDQESSKKEFARERAAVLPGLLFYKAASLAALGRDEQAVSIFEAFLALQPNVTLDPALNPKPVLAAMEKALPSVNVSRCGPANSITNGLVRAAQCKLRSHAGQPRRFSGSREMARHTRR